MPLTINEKRALWIVCLIIAGMLAVAMIGSSRANDAEAPGWIDPAVTLPDDQQKITGIYVIEAIDGRKVFVPLPLIFLIDIDKDGNVIETWQEYHIYAAATRPQVRPYRYIEYPECPDLKMEAMAR